MLYGVLRGAALRRARLGRLMARAVASMPAAPGRYEGTVRRQSDASTFDRAIEVGTPDPLWQGAMQPISIFDEVGGGLPQSPQASGDAIVLGLGNFLLFRTTDNVAHRVYVSGVFNDLMLSYSNSRYHDGRPDVELKGVLRRKALSTARRREL